MNVPPMFSGPNGPKVQCRKVPAADSHPVCAISVDLDGIECYYGIHGLGAAPALLRGVVLTRALPRFLELFDRLRIPATFFVIGRDAEADGQAVRAAAAAGHEIANHSYTHPYRLLQLEAPEMEHEIARAHDVLAAAAGVAPVGFRSPGYMMNVDLLALLGRLGYRYDSSMFPCWPYYAAKAVVMAWMGLRGRRSASMLHDPRTMLCPSLPYRPDPMRPWRRGGASLVELPVAVTPFLRLPAIGTVLLAGPGLLRRHIVRSMRKRPFFNLEMHGIELCDARADAMPDTLVRRQPDLRVTLDEKTARLGAVLDGLSKTTRFVTLREAAEQVESAIPLAPAAAVG